jgi:hypothetical protein
MVYTCLSSLLTLILPARPFSCPVPESGTTRNSFDRSATLGATKERFRCFLIYLGTKIVTYPLVLKLPTVQAPPGLLSCPVPLLFRKGRWMLDDGVYAKALLALKERISNEEDASMLRELLLEIHALLTLVEKQATKLESPKPPSPQ